MKDRWPEAALTEQARKELADKQRRKPEQRPLNPSKAREKRAGAVPLHDSSESSEDEGLATAIQSSLDEFTGYESCTVEEQANEGGSNLAEVAGVTEGISGIELGGPAAEPDASPGRTPIPEPEKEPVQSAAKVSFWQDWKTREKYLGKAKKADQRGELSESDKHLVNWFIAGCTSTNWSRECFKESTFAEVWEAVNDSKKLEMMKNAPDTTVLLRDLGRRGSCSQIIQKER
jgi:hypothetical protein